MSKVKAMEKCPFCGADGKNWRRSYITSLKSELSRLSGLLFTKRIELNDILEKLNRAELARTEAEAALEKHQKQKVELERLSAEVSRLRDAMAQRASLIAAIGDTSLVPVDAARNQTLLEKIQKVETHISILEVAVKRQAARVAEQNQINQAKSDLENCQARLAVSRELVREVKMIKDGMATTALQTLMDQVNTIIKGVLPGTAYITSDGEIGLKQHPPAMRMEKEWSRWSMSGTERTLTFAALGAALAQEAPIRLIMIDELGVFTRENKRRLLDHVAKLIDKDVIDQFIGVDVSEADYEGFALPKVQIIKL